MYRRTVLFTLALLVSVATIAEAKPVHLAADKVWTDGGGVTHIVQAKAGIINGRCL